MAFSCANWDWMRCDDRNLRCAYHQSPNFLETQGHVRMRSQRRRLEVGGLRMASWSRLILETEMMGHESWVTRQPGGFDKVHCGEESPSRIFLVEQEKSRARSSRRAGRISWRCSSRTLRCAKYCLMILRYIDIVQNYGNILQGHIGRVVHRYLMVSRACL
jgi:hypothetical protein